uniref:Large ribosomal subunit protein bL34m n=1 Tax=Reclinomonas americana ATCC 50633 TaxID=1295593 RepID=M4QLL5_RECAM|nr:ribosomal protein L34 [Reclinomonas americana ATCC 50633]
MKRTFQPSTIVKKRKHGFLSRNKTKTGKAVLKRRLLKGRKSI